MKVTFAIATAAIVLLCYLDYRNNHQDCYYGGSSAAGAAMCR